MLCLWPQRFEVVGIRDLASSHANISNMLEGLNTFIKKIQSAACDAPFHRRMLARKWERSPESPELSGKSKVGMDPTVSEPIQTLWPCGLSKATLSWIYIVVSHYHTICPFLGALTGFRSYERQSIHLVLRSLSNRDQWRSFG